MTETKSHDELMMHRAIQIGNEARIIAPPNPWVGCVITKYGQIISEGFTQTPGQAHAEVAALRAAGDHAQGATAYVTLEPCCHYGRTPPCTKALLKAGIERVVIGIEDPDPIVSGKGIAALHEAGIEVTVGIHAEAIKKQLAPYIHHRTTGLPYCVGKSAISIDGRIAAKDGSSQWISSEKARLDAHRLRAESQAILIGAGTAIADAPRLTVRNVEQMPSTPPLRVIFDAAGRVPAKGPLFDTKEAPTLIFTTSSCPEKVKKEWQNHGVEIEILPHASTGKGIDLTAALEILGKRKVVQALVEGGATLLGSFIAAKLLHHLRLYVGPCILGDEGIPLFRLEGIHSLSQAPRLNLTDTKAFGDTVRLDYHL
jgi:diaminohydroxyphosphoribosylaminopyrimidine deaminase/5-amino-6-(5-phosphoribosylamino)uracil reductase